MGKHNSGYGKRKNETVDSGECKNESSDYAVGSDTIPNSNEGSIRLDLKPPIESSDVLDWISYTRSNPGLYWIGIQAPNPIQSFIGLNKANHEPYWIA